MPPGPGALHKVIGPDLGDIFGSSFKKNWLIIPPRFGALHITSVLELGDVFNLQLEEKLADYCP